MYLPLENIFNILYPWATSKYLSYIIGSERFSKAFSLSEKDFVHKIKSSLSIDFETKKLKSSNYKKTLQVEELDWDSFNYPLKNNISKFKMKAFLSISANPHSAGYWNSSTKTLKVTAYCPYELNLNLYQIVQEILFIKSTIRHEVQHLSQWVGEITIGKPLSHGLPPKKTRSYVNSHISPGYWRDNSDFQYPEYIDDDLEFFPHLWDQIDYISSSTNFDQLTKKEKRSFITSFSLTNKFLKTLYDYNFPKWKYAVKTLYLELSGVC